MRKLKMLILLILCSGCICQNKTPIEDQANLLTDNEKRLLNQEIVLIMNETDVEVGIFIEDKLEGVLEVESRRIAEKWGIGKQGINNGVLIFVALQDRKLRVETGYGMEWTLTDSKALEVIYVMAPKFKSKKYFDGLKLALKKIKKENVNVDWKIQEKSVDLASNEDIGKIFKISENKIKEINREEDNLILMTENDEWILLSTKNMKELLTDINEESYSGIYARLNNLNEKKLLLLGVN